MARGLPAVWSTLAALPFFWAGFQVHQGNTNVTTDAGFPIVVFGGFIIAAGCYIHFIAAPEPPTLRDDEEMVETREPAQRATMVKIVIGTTVLSAAGYLYFYTVEPYVYPTTAFAVGLYLFSTGLHTYWTNTLTTYYLTNHRIIKEYRFISLVRQEIPFEKIRGVEERQSLWEAIVGLGNVRIASGAGGGTLEVVVRNIHYSPEFADEIRELAW